MTTFFIRHFDPTSVTNSRIINLLFRDVRHLRPILDLYSRVEIQNIRVEIRLILQHINVYLHITLIPDNYPLMPHSFPLDSILKSLAFPVGQPRPSLEKSQPRHSGVGIEPEPLYN